MERPLRFGPDFVCIGRDAHRDNVFAGVWPPTTMATFLIVVSALCNVLLNSTAARCQPRAVLMRLAASPKTIQIRSRGASPSCLIRELTSDVMSASHHRATVVVEEPSQRRWIRRHSGQDQHRTRNPRKLNHRPKASTSLDVRINSRPSEIAGVASMGASIRFVATSSKVGPALTT
jgi:hypothetical protein